MELYKTLNCELLEKYSVTMQSVIRYGEACLMTYWKDELTSNHMSS